MQITYNETQKGYEVTVSAEEKHICSAMIERYGFKWSEKKQLFWAAENEQSNMFIQMVGLVKAADTFLTPKQEIQMNIRRFFSRGNYSFNDIAIVSAATVEEVKLNVVEMCSDSELRKAGLYDKLIDREIEYVVLSCMAMFPETEDNAIQYILKERKIFVSASCIAAIRKENYSKVMYKGGEDTTKQKAEPEKQTKNKTDETKNKEQKREPTASPEKKKPEMEKVSVNTVKKEYYEEHKNCTSIHVRKALAEGKFDVADIAFKAGVKEETVKCKIVEILSKEELEKFGFLKSFITIDEAMEERLVQYIKELEELPETWKLKGAIYDNLNFEVPLVCLKTIMKKHDIKENVPEVVYRPKSKGR